MDLNDLLGFDEEDIGPLMCYVCGTTDGVVRQDVLKSADVTDAEIVPVCGRCSNAVHAVLALEDDFENIRQENARVTDALVDSLRLLAEGYNIVQTLQVELLEKESQIQQLNAEAEALFADNVSLAGEVEDLEKRIENGAGLFDVELAVIASSDYED